MIGKQIKKIILDALDTYKEGCRDALDDLINEKDSKDYKANKDAIALCNKSKEWIRDLDVSAPNP